MPAPLARRVLGVGLLLAAVVAAQEQPKPGTLTLRVAGADDKPLPCRVHLTDAAGKAVRAEKMPFWRDHFVCPGEVELSLPPGTYRYEIERGPEWRRLAGTVEVKAGETKATKLRLVRLIDMPAEGWYGGDLHVHRPPDDIPLLMQAEDLHVAPVITWWNKTNLWEKREQPAELLGKFDGRRFYHLMGGEDERGGGALLYLNGPKPLPITKATREFPAETSFIAQGRANKGTWIDVEKPFWWDVPVWVATGEVDSIGIAHNHMHRGGIMDSEAWGRPRVRERYPEPAGNGLWTQHIYYQLLNSGLRLPPSAGSASGVLPNPVGYDRVYVHTGKDLTWDGWWEGLKAGRSFVTNGPLLRVKVDGKLPGHVFTSDKEVEVEIEARLDSNDAVKTLEVVKDGEVVETLPVKKESFEGKVAKVKFAASGWFLVRAMVDHPRTFRFASTAPYYVEVGDRKRRVHAESVKFFLTWLDERAALLKKALPDEEKSREVMAFHDKARRFWEARLAEAKDR